MERYFSVIIPLYNKRNYIHRAIESVLSQTYQHFELIVINDGSNDGSEQEVTRYGNHPNIRVINQKNCGVSIARNNGVSLAKHELVCFLDSDDQWKPDFLEEISSLITLFPEKHIYSTRHEIVEVNGSIIYPQVYTKKDFCGVINNFIHDYKSSDGLINASSVCLRKPLFTKLGGFPSGQAQGEDIYLWLLYGLHTDIVYSNKICTQYYRNTENRSVDRMISHELPFQFVYFYKLLRKNDVKNKDYRNNKNALIKYLRKDALLHIADLKASNNSEIALSHSALLTKQNKITGFLCYLILLIPSNLLKTIKNIRNNARAYQ